jgi:hypothetical protein
VPLFDQMFTETPGATPKVEHAAGRGQQSHHFRYLPGVDPGTASATESLMVIPSDYPRVPIERPFVGDAGWLHR